MTDATTALLAPYAARCYVDGVAPAWENADRTCHLFHFIDGVHHVWAFSGTLPKLDEWLVDFDAVDQGVHDHPLLGPVHAGLWRNTVGAVGFITATMEALGWPAFYLCGHSKGAGQAILAAAALTDAGHAPVACRAFEPPRVGHQQLRQFLAGSDLVWTQTVNSCGPDIVTVVPFWGGWTSAGSIAVLHVPDEADVATKHKIPAVLAALGLPPVVGA